MRRMLLTLAALSIPLAGAATVGITTPAWAGVKITCTTISGPAAGPVVISGCTGGVTGGSSLPLAAIAAGGPVGWVSGSSTTLGTPVVTVTSAKKCPGYVKPPKGTTPPEPSAFKLSAAVTADTGDGLKVPGKVTGAICVDTSGNLSMLKAFKFS